MVATPLMLDGPVAIFGAHCNFDGHCAGSGLASARIAVEAPFYENCDEHIHTPRQDKAIQAGLAMARMRLEATCGELGFFDKIAARAGCKLVD